MDILYLLVDVSAAAYRIMDGIIKTPCDMSHLNQVRVQPIDNVDPQAIVLTLAIRPISDRKYGSETIGALCVCGIIY